MEKHYKENDTNLQSDPRTHENFSYHIHHFQIHACKQNVTPNHPLAVKTGENSCSNQYKGLHSI